MLINFYIYIQNTNYASAQFFFSLFAMLNYFFFNVVFI